jgi:DNA-binding transcriptional MerR regulator
MDGGTLYSIGDLARLTGLTVKTIRFYSDQGIVPAADRSAAGHRRYDREALARLGLVRTLRELGVDLPAIRKVIDREAALAEVAAVHAEVLEVQMRVLRLRHAVLAAVARRGSTPEEMDLMHKLVKLSEDERHHLVAEFLDAASGDSEFAGIRRSLTPELPDEPTSVQLEAWIELAELTRDPDFRALMRGLFDDHAADALITGPPRRHAVGLVTQHVTPALADRLPPTGPEAAAIVTAVTTVYAGYYGRPDDAALRTKLRTSLEAANDLRRLRYVHLLSVINGWGGYDHPSREIAWFLQALD